jgi:Protein of unknown function (DUF1631)
MQGLEPKLKAKDVVTEISRERAKLVQHCAEVLEHRLIFQLPNALDKLLDQLSLAADSSNDQNTIGGFLSSRSAIDVNKSEITADFGDALREQIEMAFEGQDHRIDGVDTEWALVDNERIEHDIAHAALERSINQRAGDVLLGLNEQLAHLLGEERLDTEQNPFGPAVITRALVHALAQHVNSVERLTHVLKMLARNQCFDIVTVYRDVSRLLEEGGFKSIRKAFKVSRSKDKTPQSNSIAIETVLNDPNQSQAFFTALMSRFSQQNGAFLANTSNPMAGDWHGQAAANTAGFPQVNEAALSGDPPVNSADLHQMLSRLLGGMGGSQLVNSTSSTDPIGVSPLPAANPALLANLHQLQFTVAPSHASIQTPSAIATGSPYHLEGDEGDVLMPLDSSAYGDHTAAAASVYQNIIRETAKQATNEQPMSVLDATTVELVAMLFDFVFSNPALKDEVKAQLSRLQIPMVRAAIIDRAFFSSRTHPARLLLNRLAGIGQHWSRNDGLTDPSYQLIVTTVNSMVSEFDSDLDVINRLLIDVESHLESERVDAEPHVEAIVETFTELDQKEQVQSETLRSLREKIITQPLPLFVLEFISTVWIKHIQILGNTQGTESTGFKQAMSTVDELLQSMRASVNAQERRLLIKTLPQLIQKLRVGCDAMALDESVKRLYFDQMFEFHARLLKGQPTHLPETPVGQSSYILDPDQELVPEADDIFQEIVEQIERGIWVELEDDTGKLQITKLSWISPKRTTFLFTTRNGMKAASYTPNELALRFRTDKARILESEPLVDRALSAILGQVMPELAAA